MPEKTELVPIEDIPLEVLRPVGSVQQILQAWQMFQELKRAIITEEDYYLDDRGKQQLKIGGWRKFAIAYGLTTELLDETIMPDKVDPREWVARVVLGVKTKGGRKTIGVGYFSTREVKHKYLEDNSIVHPTKTDKSGAPIPVPLEHITTSRAYTRALKRGVQDMIGPVEQEEDEPEGPEQPAPKAPTPTPTPAAAPQQRDPVVGHVKDAAALWDFLDEVLGKDLADQISVDATGDEILVKLDKLHLEKYGNAFLSRMMKWGYGTHETPAGMVSMIKRPRAVH
jgi:hypothetical protein